MISIKFITFGANSAFGSFAPGDVMRCGEDLARHLVDELKVAVYAAQVIEEKPKRKAKK